MKLDLTTVIMRSPAIIKRYADSEGLGKYDTFIVHHIVSRMSGGSAGQGVWGAAIFDEVGKPVSQLAKDIDGIIDIVLECANGGLPVKREALKMSSAQILALSSYVLEEIAAPHKIDLPVVVVGGQKIYPVQQNG